MLSLKSYKIYEEGNAAGDDSDVAQKPKGAGAGAEQGDASNFTAFQGTMQVKYTLF